jgi:hypothetical protein
VTLYPMDFHRRVDRRWAERMKSAAAEAYGSMPDARLAARQRNKVRPATEALHRLPRSEAAQGSQPAPLN